MTKSFAREPIETDILIIGAGPVGLFGAYYAGFRGMSVVVMDSLPQPGGQVSAMYPGKEIRDIGGIPRIRGGELVRGLLEQAAPFNPVYKLGIRASDLAVTGPDGPFLVSCQPNGQVLAKSVLITGGVGHFTPRPLPAAVGYRGEGVDYFVSSFEEYSGFDTVIVGGGDSAFDWAAAICPYASSTTVVHRRSTFRAHPGLVKEATQGGVEIITGAVVDQLVGDEKLSQIQIRDIESGASTGRRCQRLVAALGFTANLGPLLQWDLGVQSRRYIPVTSRMETRRPGIFAAGDIVDYPGKVRLIAVGFGESATAINNAAVFIDPTQHLFPGHSTETETSETVDDPLAKPFDQNSK